MVRAFLQKPNVCSLLYKELLVMYAREAKKTRVSVHFCIRLLFFVCSSNIFDCVKGCTCAICFWDRYA